MEGRVSMISFGICLSYRSAHMSMAFVRRVTVKSGGHIELDSPELQPGTQAEVIMIPEDNGAAVARERNLPVIRVDELIRRGSEAGEQDWHREPRRRIGRHRTRKPPDTPAGLGGDKHPNAYGAQRIAEFYFARLEPLVAGLWERGASG